MDRHAQPRTCAWGVVVNARPATCREILIADMVPRRFYTLGDLAEMTGAATKTLQHTLRKLQAEGVVSKRGPRSWSMTPWSRTVVLAALRTHSRRYVTADHVSERTGISLGRVRRALDGLERGGLAERSSGRHPHTGAPGADLWRLL